MSTVLTVNGGPWSWEGTGLPTVADVVAAWCPSPRGVAVARNGEVVPRSRWEDQRLEPGDALELVTAVAGG